MESLIKSLNERENQSLVGTCFSTCAREGSRGWKSFVDWDNRTQYQIKIFKYVSMIFSVGPTISGDGSNPVPAADQLPAARLTEAATTACKSSVKSFEHEICDKLQEILLVQITLHLVVVLVKLPKLFRIPWFAPSDCCTFRKHLSPFALACPSCPVPVLK